MTIRGWHFCKDVNGHPVLRDGTPCPTAGAAEVFDGDPVMCEQGLHWSEMGMDALSFAPGPWVRLVEGEPTETDKYKVVGRKRRTLTGPINVERTLRGFAALCALRALRRYADPNTREACLPAIRCALTYWRASVWPEDREAAMNAARAYAWAAARAAASDAAWAADRAAASNAASDAAMDAAWAAAWAAARAAVSNAARAAARAAVLDAARAEVLDAAWAADWAAGRAAAQDAARNAERDWQNRLLEAMLRKALEVRQ